MTVLEFSSRTSEEHSYDRGLPDACPNCGGEHHWAGNDRADYTVPKNGVHASNYGQENQLLTACCDSYETNSQHGPGFLKGSLCHPSAAQNRGWHQRWNRQTRVSTAWTKRALGSLFSDSGSRCKNGWRTIFRIYEWAICRSSSWILWTRPRSMVSSGCAYARYWRVCLPSANLRSSSGIPSPEAGCDRQAEIDSSS